MSKEHAWLVSFGWVGDPLTADAVYDRKKDAHKAVRAMGYRYSKASEGYYHDSISVPEFCKITKIPKNKLP